jgi:hypothetical protein
MRGRLVTFNKTESLAVSITPDGHEVGSEQPLTESGRTQPSKPSAPKRPAIGAFGLVLLSIGLSVDWLWEQTIRPNLEASALIRHQRFIDWPSLVCYLVIGGGAFLSGYFFHGYYRAYDFAEEPNMLLNTVTLAGLFTGFALVGWAVFDYARQLSAYIGGYVIPSPAILAADVVAPWLIGGLLLFWSRSMIRFANYLDGKLEGFSVIRIAANLFIMAGFLSFIIPAFNVLVGASLLVDDNVFYLYSFYLFDEAILSPANLSLTWAASILAIASWRSLSTHPT